MSAPLTAHFSGPGARDARPPAAERGRLTAPTPSKKAVMIDKIKKFSPVIALISLGTSVIVGEAQFWSSKVAQDAYDASMVRCQA